MHYSTWTDEAETARLVKMWNEGLSTGLIAERFKRSRNAVIGKVNRMGLAKRVHQAAPYFPERKPVIACTSRLCDLGPHDCRWPEGDSRDSTLGFCGRPVKPGRPYCPEHCGVAYQCTA